MQNLQAHITMTVSPANAVSTVKQANAVSTVKQANAVSTVKQANTVNTVHTVCAREILCTVRMGEKAASTLNRSDVLCAGRVIAMGVKTTQGMYRGFAGKGLSSQIQGEPGWCLESDRGFEGSDRPRGKKRSRTRNG